MNLLQARIVLRQRTMSEVLDLAVRWLASVGGAVYLWLSVVLLLPSVILCFALQRYAAWEWTSVWTLGITLSMFTQGAFTVAASRLMFEPHVTTRGVLRQFFGRFWTYVGALMATRLYLGLASLLVFLVPWAWAKILFIHEAVLLEGLSVGQAVQRAGRFVTGEIGSVFGLLLALGISVLVVVGSVEFLGQGLVDFTLQLGAPLGELLEDGGSLFALIGFHLAIPFIATARFLKYIDARTKRDGWDIQLRFMAIAAESERREVA